MPELRQNLATKQWVIIATERAKRPHDFVGQARKLTHEEPEHLDNCPFCPGNEHETPEDLIRWPHEGDWQLRLFPNRFPALRRDGARVQCVEGVQRKLSGVGYHEVLVESPLHNSSPAFQSPEEICLTFKAFQTRGRDLMIDKRVEQVVYFKNHGPSAGTSIAHTHAQLLALPMVPHNVRTRIEEVRHTIDDSGVCPYCQMLDLELEQGERVVAANEAFVAFVPYAAPSPFHMWVVPRRHGPTFLDQTTGELMALSRLMRELLGKLYHGLHDPDYNYIIRSAPNRDSSSAYLHWYVSIVPRVTRTAGFELGSGMYINPSLPEESARFLRDQEPGQVCPAPFPLHEVLPHSTSHSLAALEKQVREQSFEDEDEAPTLPGKQDDEGAADVRDV